MTFSPFEVTPPHIIYVGLGAFVCIFSYLSLFIKERLYLGEAPIAAAFGVIVGPVAIDLFNPARWGGEPGETPGGHVTDEVTLEVMRVTIALSVFAIGVELPKKYLLRHWRSIAILLGPVMLWGWLITGLLIWAMIPGLDYLTSLVVAACVSPTDPILAQAVVGGPWADKHVPAHVRHMLMCESGCNDGAAFPFLYLALYLVQERSGGSIKHAIAKWFYETWAYEIILGTLLGALIGYAARKFMRFSERHKMIDRESFVAQYISLAIVSMGVNVLLGSDDLLAAFACGTAFAWDGWFTKQTEDSNFSNIIDLLFNIATFIYIGALIPWHDFANAAIGLSVWRLIVLAILVLLLKRLPIILALWKWMPDIKTFREAVFSGHFGPMGVGAIFIATLGRTLLPEEVPETPETVEDQLANVIQPIVYFFVLCSIIVHGLTIPFFAFGKNAGRRAHTLTRTWSRNPSMAAEEPGWMSRVRRVRTGEDIIINTDDISAEKMTAAQLAMIGRGAIGGPIEDELRNSTPGGGSEGEGDSSSGRTGGSFAGLLNRTTERDLEKAEGSLVYGGTGSDSSDEYDAEERRRLQKKAEMDGVEDWDDDEHFDPSCDYLGDDCAEMKRYRAQLAAKREARGARQAVGQEERSKAQQQEEQDIGEAPMDRDIIDGRIRQSDEDAACRTDREGQAHFYHDGGAREADAPTAAQAEDDDDETKFPRLRDWVEGKQLVLEYQSNAAEDPVVHVIKLSNDEAKSLSTVDSPAHKWLQQNKEAVGEIIGSEQHHQWNPAEAISGLIENGVPKFWSKRKRASTASNVSDRSTGKSDKGGTRDGDHQACKSLEEMHSRVDERRGSKDAAAVPAEPEAKPRSDPKTNRRSYIAATAPPEESQAERDERAAMLFGAMSWARDNRDPDEAPSATPSRTATLDGGETADAYAQPPLSSSRRSSTSSGSRSRSASPFAHGGGVTHAAQQPHVSGGTHGSKRFSLRKKVLNGQIGLSGRRKGPSTAAMSDPLDEYDEGDEDSIPVGSRTPSGSASIISAPPAPVSNDAPSPGGTSARPTVVISAPPSRPSSGTQSPGKERRTILRLGAPKGIPRTNSSNGEKFFPRSSSAGAGLSEHDRSLRFNTAGSSMRRNMMPSSSSIFSSSSTSTAASSSAQEKGKGKGSHNRTSSIQWLDVADASHERRPRREVEAQGGSSSLLAPPENGGRRRTLSSASSSSTIAAAARRGEVNVPTDSAVASSDDDDNDDEDGGAGGGANLAERGKNRLVNFFSNFTAPKGEGMGNPGPTSHPHLFPHHHSSRRKKRRNRNAVGEQGGGGSGGETGSEEDEPSSSLPDAPPEGHEVRHASSAPHPTTITSTSTSGGGGDLASVLLSPRSFTDAGPGTGTGGREARVMIDMPHDDLPPVPAGSRR